MAQKKRHLIEIDILIAIVLIVAVLSTVSTYITLNLERQAIDKDLLETARLVSSTIYRSLEIAMIDQKKVHVHQMVKSLSAAKNIDHIRIFDLEGNVWSGPEQDPKHILKKERIVQVLKSGEYSTSHVKEDDEEILETLTPVHSDQRCYSCHGREKKYLGLIEVGISTGQAATRVRSYHLREGLTTLVSVIAIILVLGGALNYLVVRPIERLTAMAEKLSRGDLSSRVSIRSRNEIGELGDVFNLMADTLEKNINELEQTKTKMETAIRNIGEAMSAALDFDSLFKVILEQATSLTECNCCSLMLVNETGELAIQATAGFTDKEVERYKKGPVRADDGILFQVVQSKTFIYAENLETKPKFKKLAVKRRARALCSFPLISEGKFIGLINIVCLNEKTMTVNEIKLLYALSSQAAVAIGHARLHEKVKKLAATDDLTGLPNVRTFYERINLEVERSRRFKHDLSLAMIDIDDFKVYNDTYGHLAGDELLWELALVLNGEARSLDLLARYGGEEFVVMMVETSALEGRELAERLRKAVNEHIFSISTVQKAKEITVSIGIASLPDHAHTVRELVDQADKALLKAKRLGKNRVVIAGRK